MRHKDLIVFKRSFETLEQMLFSNRYGFSRPDLSILDLSRPESGLVRELKRVGYDVQRLDSGQELREPLDLIVCDGPFASSIDLHELIQTFQPGFQIILLNQPIQRNGQSDPSYFNPSSLGKYRLYPIAKWTDAFYGLPTMFRLMDCPIVKIKPIR
jgi:hypothetical protein